MSIGPNCSRRSAMLLLGSEQLPQRAAEDVRLSVLSDPARLEHLAVALDLAVELLDLAAEDIGPEHHLLKRARSAFRRMRTDHARPPENRLECLIVLLQLDERRARQIEIEVRIPPPDLGRPRVIGIP